MIKNKIIFGKSPEEKNNEDVSSITHHVSTQTILSEFIKAQINVTDLKEDTTIISKNDSKFTIQKLSENKYCIYMTKRTSEKIIAVGEIILDGNLNIL